MEKEIYAIGDASLPGRAGESIEDGAQLGIKI